jgi:carboxypeptidase family protein
MRYLASALLAYVLTCAGLFAQTAATAQISGTVLDSSGLAVPGAQVTATQTGTGVTRTALTGTDGGYVLPSLPVGPYRIEVKKEGFTAYVQSGIVLQVNTNPTIEVTLKVGSVTEQVVVEAAASMVETRSTGVGEVIDSQRVVELPLNGRQATQLINLAGAAVTIPLANVGQLYSGKNNPDESPISVAGGGANSALTYVLDGASHNDPLNNLGLPLPFPDALQEFKVETSAVPAPSMS